MQFHKTINDCVRLLRSTRNAKDMNIMKFINIEHIKVFSISKVKKIMANNNRSHSKRIMNILKHAVFITIFNFRKNLEE